MTIVACDTGRLPKSEVFMYSGLKNLAEDYLSKCILTVSSLWQEVSTLLFTRTVEPFFLCHHASLSLAQLIQLSQIYQLKQWHFIELCVDVTVELGTFKYF